MNRRRERPDEPFGDALARGIGESGRRQAQRRAHQLIRRAREMGNVELAHWLADRFRDGTLTDDGADGEPGRVAHTLAAARICEFAEMAGAPPQFRYGRATLVFDRPGPGSRAVHSNIWRYDLRDLGQANISASLLAAAFGLDASGSWSRMRYMQIDELSPDPDDAQGRDSLDAWEEGAIVGRPTRSRTGTEQGDFRVRFAWQDQAGDVFLARLVQAFRSHVSSADPRPLLKAIGSPFIHLLPDSRLGAERWDRLLLDAFAANRTHGPPGPAGS
jgi:hypothetical protein